jgi:plasmid stabilization system protein ParE
MRKFGIRYNPEALSDLSDSFEWGVQFWGAEAARKWYNEVDVLIESRLSSMPGSCPLAPENDDLDIEVRQLILGRYRILFTIEDDLVRVLYIRGPYSCD